MKKAFFTTTLLIIAFHFSGLAQLGAIAVNPTRLNFDDQKRREEVEFINLSNDTLTFTITFSHYKMVENGSLILLDEPDTSLLIVDDYIRIFPRKVTIGPREKQKVSLQYRRNAAMKAGEYRSHLTFSQFIDETKLAEEYAAEDSTALQTVLFQLFKICIPIMIRTGDIEVESSIDNISLEHHDTIQTVSFNINRIGNTSLYGTVEVEYQPLQGKPYVVSRQKYVGIYTEVNRREFKLRMSNEEQELFDEGTLTIRYNNGEEKDPITFCEKKFNIQ